MAEIPVMFSGVLYPKDRMHAPMPVVFIGVGWNPDLGIGGGPVYPPAGGGQPPGIWGPTDPRPTPPIAMPPWWNWGGPPDQQPPHPQFPIWVPPGFSPPGPGYPPGIGGGPIIPPTPEPPLVIWGPDDPRPTPPIMWPGYPNWPPTTPSPAPPPDKWYWAYDDN